MIGQFWGRLRALDAPCRVLDCGSLRRAGHAPGVLPREVAVCRPDALVIGLDVKPGPGVDLVADLHDLRAIPEGHFAAVLCCSTLEHVRRPWVVARELARVTRPGGWLFCSTHQTFPYHPDYGGDYFRFSADALREVFSSESGWHVAEAGHEFPCKVVPLENAFGHAKDWNFAADAWLLSCCLAQRIAR